MRTMDPGYPKPITIWKGIPDSPQGAFVDKANGVPRFIFLTLEQAIWIGNKYHHFTTWLSRNTDVIPETHKRSIFGKFFAK